MCVFLRVLKLIFQRYEKFSAADENDFVEKKIVNIHIACDATRFLFILINISSYYVIRRDAKIMGRKKHNTIKGHQRSNRDFGDIGASEVGTYLLSLVTSIIHFQAR